MLTRETSIGFGMKNASILNIPDMAIRGNVTTQEYVYQRLKNAIMLGALKPGTSLTMRGLADFLGLSPTPVREALRRLSSENAVAVLGNRRIMVPTMDAGRFDELVALRISLEVHAGLRSLPHISDVIINDIAAIDDEMDKQLIARDLDKLTLLNQEFHRTLYSANVHQAIMPAIESVWLQLGPFQRQVIENIQEFYLIDRHKEILSALRDRDPAALETAITNDIQDSLILSGRDLIKAQNLAEQLT